MADALARFRAPRPHAADGDEDKVPRIALDETPAPLLVVTTLAGWRGHPRREEPGHDQEQRPQGDPCPPGRDRRGKAWQYAKVPCPQVSGPHLRTRLWAAEKALSTALQVDGAVGVDARLAPRERKEAEVRFGERLAAVLGAPV
ncbi:hypothetical protein [Nonomuraea bangladeshensis]|uniref:hypothetical protein n=1 Tax=Nonomuraea bangladeshensis TaxID=404385 RepID=UPI003C2F3576